MRKVLIPVVLALALASSGTAEASLFTLDSYTVSLRSHDPGLVLWELDLLTLPASFELDEVGESYTTELFRVGTRESYLNLDDLLPYSIDVGFSFSSPPPGFGGNADGITGAGWLGESFGYVIWDNPLTLDFGTDGLLEVTLSNTTFGLPGAGTVDARFRLLREDSGLPSASIPEPSSMMLIGLGLAAAGIRRHRAA